MKFDRDQTVTISLKIVAEQHGGETFSLRVRPKLDSNVANMKKDKFLQESAQQKVAIEG